MKHLLIIVALGLCSLSLKAQTYVPFPTSSDNAVWTISTSRKEVSCRYYDLFITGDTIIANKNYVVLGWRGIYQPWVSTGLGSGYCGQEYQFINSRRLAYREDSLRKVYIRDFSGWDTTEVLLFDFSLQIGDSLKGHYAQPWYNGLIPVVSSIDSVLIDNNWRKKINFANEQDNQEGCFFMIEGIGSSFGFLDMQYCPTFEGNATLICYKLNSIKQFPFDNAECSDYSYVTSTQENNPSNRVITISPNPANNYVHISLDNKSLQTQLVIYSITGQLLSQQPITSNQIPIAELSNGMYIFVIQNGDRVLSRQRVVISK